MPDPTASTAPHDPFATESPAALAAGSVVESLARLLAAASIYPAAHPRIAEIVEPVLAAVAEGARSGGRLRVDIAGTALPATATAGARRLVRELTDIGIRVLEVGGEVSVADLVALARFLKKHAGARVGDAGFRHVDFAELPPVFRVEERSFGVPSFAEDGHEAGADGRGPDAPIEPASPKERLDPKLAELVWRVVRAAIPEQRTSAVRGADAHGVAAKPEHVAHATANAVRDWLERRFASQSATPKEILAEAERSLPSTLPGVAWGPVLDSLRHVMDQHLTPGFSEEARADFDRRQAAPEEGAAVSASDDELVRRIARITDGAPTFALDASLDRAEHVSILLHLPEYAVQRAEADGIASRLAIALSGPFGQRERSVVAGWLRDLAVIDRPAETDRRLTPVMDALRLAERSRAAELLLEACREPYQGIADAIWPELAYELATNADDSVRERLVRLVSRVPVARTSGEPDRLRTLIAARRGAVALDALFPPRRELHAFYAALLDTPAEAGFAEAVTDAFVQHPPHHPAAGALIVLAPDDERTHRLLARLLREGEEPTAASKALACEVLIAALEEVALPDRGEDWVTEAIGALGDLASPAARAFLEGVVSERRFLVVPAWPETARAVASLALSRGGADAEVRR